MKLLTTLKQDEHNVSCDVYIDDTTNATIKAIFNINAPEDRNTHANLFISLSDGTSIQPTKSRFDAEGSGSFSHEVVYQHDRPIGGKMSIFLYSKLEDDNSWSSAYSSVEMTRPTGFELVEWPYRGITTNVVMSFNGSDDYNGQIDAYMYLDPTHKFAWCEFSVAECPDTTNDGLGFSISIHLEMNGQTIYSGPINRYVTEPNGKPIVTSGYTTPLHGDMTFTMRGTYATDDGVQCGYGERTITIYIPPLGPAIFLKKDSGEWAQGEAVFTKNNDIWSSVASIQQC